MANESVGEELEHYIHKTVNTELGAESRCHLQRKTKRHRQLIWEGTKSTSDVTDVKGQFLQDVWPTKGTKEAVVERKPILGKVFRQFESMTTKKTNSVNLILIMTDIFAVSSVFYK